MLLEKSKERWGLTIDEPNLASVEELDQRSEVRAFGGIEQGLLGEGQPHQNGNITGRPDIDLPLQPKGTATRLLVELEQSSSAPAHLFSNGVEKRLKVTL
jgi:hypothetical protein